VQTHKLRITETGFPGQIVRNLIIAVLALSPLGNVSCSRQPQSAKAEESSNAPPKVFASLDRRGYTPLHHAVLEGDFDKAKKLLDDGFNVDSQDKAGRTPLMLGSMMRDRYEIVELLLQRGGNANAKDSEGLTPLHFATRSGQGGVRQLLIENGATK